MMIFAVYPRKSKKDDNSQSMEQQIYDCEQYIKQNYKDYKIVLYDKDYALTGHSTKKRKDFQRMMEDVKAHKINAVVVMRYDRIARNTRDFCNLYYEMEQVGCNLISISQRIDTSTPYGKKFMYDMASMAELEWAITSERYKDSARYKIAKGYAYTGSVPTGFKIENIDGRKLVVKDNPETTMQILDFYRTSKSKRATVVYVRENLIPDFTTNKLNGMLNSDLFFGKCRDNLNFCEPYMTESEMMELRNISQIKSTPSGNIYLFTGMVKCPLCGAAMCGLYMNRKMRGDKRKLYTYYRCSKGGKYKLHKMNTLNEATVEKYLLENLDNELHEYIISAKTEMKAGNKKSNMDQQEKVKSELKRINYMFEKGRLSEDEYDKKYIEINIKLKELIDKNNIGEEKLVRIAKIIPPEWKDIYQSLDKLGRQRFWHNIISDITIDESFKITGFHFL